jgi:intracellular septation protein A
MSLKDLLPAKEKRRRFAHITASFIIFFHAYERFEHGKNSYLFFTVAGIIFFLIAVFHPILERRAPWIDGLFLVIEGLLSFVMAVDAFSAGKKALPVAYLLLGCFQLFMAFRKGRKGIRNHSETQASPN